MKLAIIRLVIVFPLITRCFGQTAAIQWEIQVPLLDPAGTDREREGRSHECRDGLSSRPLQPHLWLVQTSGPATWRLFFDCRG